MSAPITDAIQYVDAMAEIARKVQHLSRMTTGPMQADVSAEELNQLVHELFVVGLNVRNVVYCINDLLLNGEFTAEQIGTIKQATSQQISLIQDTVVSIKDFVDARDVLPAPREIWLQ